MRPSILSSVINIVILALLASYAVEGRGVDHLFKFVRKFGGQRTKSPIQHHLSTRNLKKQTGTVTTITSFLRGGASSGAGTSVSNNDLCKHESSQSQQFEPTIKAILIPRKISIPRLIRLLSAFIFTASLSESFRTAGLPHANAVRDILTENGMLIHMAASSSKTYSKVSPLDVYLARKISSSSGNILPPQYLPSTLPFVGLWVALFLQVAVTILFPKWFIGFDVWLNYHRVDVSPVAGTYHGNGSDSDSNTKLHQSNEVVANHLNFLSSRLDEHVQSSTSTCDNNDDDYSSSQLMNRYSMGLNDGAVGLAALVRLSKRDQEMSDDGKADAVRWIYTSEDKDQPYQHYIELNQRRVYLDVSITKQGGKGSYKTQPQITAKCHSGAPTFFQTQSITSLLTNAIPHGLSVSPDSLLHAQNRYGPYANTTLPSPTIQSVFLRRLGSPLVILQLLGKVMTMLEEEPIASIWSLLLIFGRHYFDARKSVVVGKELAGEVEKEAGGVGEMMVWTLRPDEGRKSVTESSTTAVKKKKRKTKRRKRYETCASWVKIPSLELLPGDIFCLPPTSFEKKGGITMPVDALLIEGSCIAQEAVITGESVPQAKVSIERDLEDNDTILSMEEEHRASVLFAGTSIVHCDNGSEKNTSGSTNIENSGLYYPKLPKELRSTCRPVKCLALRTGCYSSKGEIIRALSRSWGRTGSVSTLQSERDSIRLITVLSTFAAVACATLFLPDASSSTRERKAISSFRRIIQCTRIAIASIPSDLPMALSSLTQECSTILRREADVMCSEPGSLLTASQVDMVVFDKTGTLTSDTQSMETVVTHGYDCVGNGTDTHRQHPMASVVLAGCHSLVSMGSTPNSGNTSTRNKLIGDPLDVASLEYSKWIYNPCGKTATAPKETLVTEKAMIASGNKHDLSRNLVAKKLWQIKSFPFDPNRRHSSAVVLVLHNDDTYRLWKVIKGSPDSMFPFFITTPHCDSVSHYQNIEMEADTPSFRHWYENTIQSLESQGIRLISMGVEEAADAIKNILFPHGLPVYGDSPSRFNRLLTNARDIAQGKLYRSYMEQSKLDFVGFSCLHAPMRPSSMRVLKEIRKSGTQVCMLTGDGIEAAFSIAEQAAFFDKRCSRKTAVLDIIDSSDDNSKNSRLVWNIIERKKKKSKNMVKKKGGRKRKVVRNQYKIYTTKYIIFSSRTISSILKEKSEGKCVILATGRAVELALSKVKTTKSSKEEIALKNLLQNLCKISVIARASPQTKQKVISALKEYCSCNVMMCGDGVNDIAAMKTSDISFALLNGFENELNDQTKGRDIENERRKEKLFASKLGKRIRNDVCFENEISVLDSKKASVDRIKRKIDEALSQTQNDSVEGLKSIMHIIKEEHKRGSILKKGGAGAARILAEDDKLAMMKQPGLDSEKLDCVNGDDLTIKTGEASLAAAFTCLRPCVDGVETVIRSGVATAAFSLSLHRTITLNSLMACYNLATLYRDGFRYGKYMWNVELTLMMFLDQARYDISCIPCPRISSVRPRQSIFHLSSALSICLQAVIHLLTLQTGVKYANLIENKFNADNDTGIKIRFSTGFSPLGSKTDSSGSILGRKPFQPNYITNTVFLLSIFQNIVISIVNHVGFPFHRSILESRQLCLSIGLCTLFCVAAAAELFPALNNLLELAIMPSKSAKMLMIMLFFIDLIGSLVVDRVCLYYFDRELFNKKSKPKSKEKNGYAAALEEDALSKERHENQSLLTYVGVLSLMVTMYAYQTG